MALLDHQVPDEAKKITIELLQKCVGNMCVAKYSNGADERKIVACGMVSSLVFSEDRKAESSSIRLYTGATTYDDVDGGLIEYVYSLSMLPGEMPLDATGLTSQPQ